MTPGAISETLMPLIQVDVFPGKTTEQKRGFVRRVTQAAVEEFGVPEESVIVLIRETPEGNWGWRGELFPDRADDRGG